MKPRSTASTYSPATKPPKIAKPQRKNMKPTYSKHADAIDAYEAAQAYFAGVMNSRKELPIKDWQKEQKKLAAKRCAMCDEYYALKEKSPQ